MFVLEQAAVSNADTSKYHKTVQVLIPKTQQTQHLEKNEPQKIQKMNTFQEV